MKLLLDTHTIIWTLFSPEKLSQNAVEAFSNPKHELFISAVSIWELSIKYKLGKIDLAQYTPQSIVDFYSNQYALRHLDVDMALAGGFYKLSALHHRDPFDRMLIWQALQHKLTVLTNDANIQKYSDLGLKVVW